jgi:hypothetical protein
MNSIFGDATTVAATPETLAEAASLFGDRSPIGSFRLGSDAGDPVPDMALQPPDVEIQDGRPLLGNGKEEGEGVGGWISKMVKSSKGDNGQSSGKYQRVGQAGDDEDEAEGGGER